MNADRAVLLTDSERKSLTTLHYQEALGFDDNVARIFDFLRERQVKLPANAVTTLFAKLPDGGFQDLRGCCVTDGKLPQDFKEAPDLLRLRIHPGFESPLSEDVSSPSDDVSSLSDDESSLSSHHSISAAPCLSTVPECTMEESDVHVRGTDDVDMREDASGELSPEYPEKYHDQERYDIEDPPEESDGNDRLQEAEPGFEDARLEVLAFLQG
jgi:hypothetical protein